MKQPFQRKLLSAFAMSIVLGFSAKVCLGQSEALIIFAQPSVDAVQVLNRITWGVNDATLETLKKQGLNRTVEQQIHPSSLNNTLLPESVQNQFDRMTIQRTPIVQLVQRMEKQRKEANEIKEDDAKKNAQQAYQREMNRLAREATTRATLRALYSPLQLQERMTFFWLNHFNVHQGKANLRALVGDYEEHAIRPYALGKFRDLLGYTAHHPAMLMYLDNAQNAVNRLNENYARELMELHTLGVNGGYTQQDVQELARILTGVSVNYTGEDNPRVPQVRPALQSQYVRDGLFEFNPNRHDYGNKLFLGKSIPGTGLNELDAALDLLARHPSTAQFICSKLAAYFVSEHASPALVKRMKQSFLQSDGDIAAVLTTMFNTKEFSQSLGKQFKDPVHYVISAVRLAYNDKPILNANPIANWLNRMGEPRYGHQTPDGYALTESAWASPGQMTTRFEVAKAIGSGSAGLFKSEEAPIQERPAFPQLANVLYYQYLQSHLGLATRQTLEQASSPQEWNTLLLSSPEMMRH